MSHKPRKRFGQNFLHDQAIIQQIIDVIDPQKGDRIIEIGPGQGALTELLLDELGHIEVIELDRDLVPLLERNMSPHGQIQIYNEDVLKFDFSKLSTAANSLRIVGNLPYNISTPLLFHLMDYLPTIIDMHFMLQKEVVERIVAQPNSKHYGRLSVMMQYYCEVEYLFTVGPEAFSPPPKVNSAIIRMAPHQSAHIKVKDEKSLSTVVRQCFAQRRKTLRNNLKGILTEEEIKSLEIDPGCRAETLTLADFAKLSDQLSSQIEN